MNIERVGRTLLGAAALCLLLVNAGCNSNPSSDNGGSLGGTSGGTQLASVQNPGDWGASLLPGGGTGVGMFPAKFTFDVTLPPDCTKDYVAYNTSVAGVSPTAAATQTGNWTATLATSGTVTITSPEAILVLTWATGMNSGLNFSGTTQALEASELVAAINRNNFATLGQGHVRVMAATNATLGQVVVTASSDGITGLNGAEGNVIGLTQTINAGRFTWSAATMAGGLGKGNIVAFNQLYSTQGSVGGACNQNGPSPDWAYFTGTGTAVTSVVISGDGTRVAYVENVGTTATLRILQWKAGEGVGAGYPVAPTLTLAAGTSWATGCPAGGSSCVRSIAFSGAAATDTNSAPFYNYNTDTLYVGDNSGRMHKFTGVFLGTPAEHCAAGCGVVDAGWPITVHAGFILTSPVYDGVSGNIFVGDSNGRLSFIQEVGSTVGGATPCTAPCLNTVNRSVGAAGTGAIVDSPIVDGTTGRVFAINGTETTNNGTILQADTGLTTASVVSFAIGGTTSPGSAIYSGAFDNAYFTSAIPAIAGHMYVCGKSTVNGDRPAIYQLSFAAATGALTGVGAALTGLVSASGEACSPVTEFYNPNGAGAGVARDWIFFSFGNNATGAAPIPAGTCRTDAIGCVMSINVTGEPAWPPTAAGAAALSVADAVQTNAAGGTGGIVVDNDAVIATSPQASNLYFSLGTNSIASAGAGIPSCNTTAGTGCAVKLTQSLLN